MKKRVLVVALLVLLAVASAFAGGAKEAKKSLTVWVEKSFSDDANYAMEQRVKEFGKEFDVDVSVEMINALDFMTKLNAAIEAGNPPDIVTANMYKVLSYGENNPFLDVTEKVAALDAEREIFDASIENTKIDGKNYYYPFYNSVSIMYYRTDKLAEAGLDIPETWEEVFEAAKAISDPDNGFYGLAMGCGPTDEDGCNTFRTIMWANGGGLYAPDGTITANTDPVVLELVEDYKDLYESEAIPPAATTWGPAGNNTSYMMGESGICYNSPTLYNSLKADPNYAELFANTVVAAPPKGATGESYALNLAFGWGIIAASKNIDTAYEFIDYTYEKEWYDSYIKQVAPVFVPVFTDAKNDPFYTDDVANAAAVGYAESAMGYYGYPVDTLEGRILASKHYYQFPVCKMLNNVVTQGMTPQQSLDALAAETQALAESI